MKKILICGALSAIARECASIWAAEGASLVLVARDKSRLESVENDLRAKGAAQVTSIVADCSDVTAQAGWLSRAEELLGGLDVALVAWGTLGDQAQCQRDVGEMLSQIQNNFLSVAALSTILANRFESRKAGTIVVIGSVAGDRGRQSNYVYGSAKGGLDLFLGGLRNRLWKAGVSVLTVKPGFVDTPMTRDIKKGPLFVTPDVVARGICRGVERGSDIVYLPWFWLAIMTVIRLIPEKLFKRLKL